MSLECLTNENKCFGCVVEIVTNKEGSKFYRGFWLCDDDSEDGDVYYDDDTK